MADEKPFRVLLDFSELNLNLSKYVWMNISPRELNNIADLKNAVLKRINIDRKDIKLFVQDGLLFEDEKIIVLRENDIVKVQYEDSSSGVYLNTSQCQSNASRCSEPEQKSENCNGEGIGNVSSRKRKRKSEMIISDITDEHEQHSKSQKKKKKHKASFNISPGEKMLLSNIEIISEPVVTNTEETTISLKSNELQNEENENKICDISICKDRSSETAFDSSQNSSAIQGNSCKKKKRKRHRKRKSVPQIIDTISDNAANVFPEVPMKNITSSTFSNNLSAVRKHIRFTSPAPSSDCAYEQNTELVDLDTYVNKFKTGNSLQTQDNVAKTPDCAPSKTFSIQKNSTPNSPHLSKNNSWHISPMENNYTTAVEQFSASQLSQVKEVLKLEKNLKVSYTDYPILDCLPSVGTHIAFKVLEMDERYNPVISDYKEGIIKNINPTNEEMEIELIESEIKPGRTGKFENLSNDEIPLPEVIKNVTLTWPSLIEPRSITE